MRIVEDIEQQIQQSEAGTLFFVSDFAAKAGNDVFISRLLSKFAKKGLLCRLALQRFSRLVHSSQFGNKNWPNG